MTDNPIELARRLGASIGGKLGEVAFQEMELAYVNAILPRFSNNPLIRPRQHLLLYWSQSYHKSTLINEFSKVIPSCIPQLDVTTNSPPTLFGSIDDSGQINYPLFANVRIPKITELSTFITSSNFAEIINPMNKILEGERVERQLLKLSRRKLTDDEVTKMVEMGVQYDPIRGELSYEPDVSVFCASRPLTNKEYTRLKSSGYLYRHHILQKQLTDKEVTEYLKANYAPDQSLYAPLKTINERIAAVKIHEINTPDDRINAELMESLIEIAKLNSS